MISPSANRQLELIDHWVYSGSSKLFFLHHAEHLVYYTVYTGIYCTSTIQYTSTRTVLGNSVLPVQYILVRSPTRVIPVLIRYSYGTGRLAGQELRTPRASTLVALLTVLVPYTYEDRVQRPYRLQKVLELYRTRTVLSRSTPRSSEVVNTGTRTYCLL